MSNPRLTLLWSDTFKSSFYYWQRIRQCLEKFIMMLQVRFCIQRSILLDCSLVNMEARRLQQSRLPSVSPWPVLRNVWQQMYGFPIERPHLGNETTSNEVCKHLCVQRPLGWLHCNDSIHRHGCYGEYALTVVQDATVNRRLTLKHVSTPLNMRLPVATCFVDPHQHIPAKQCMISAANAARREALHCLATCWTFFLCESMTS